MKKKSEFDIIIDIYNDFNEELGSILSNSNDVDILKVLWKYGQRYSKNFNKGWQDLSGKKIRYPFELNMMGIALLTSMWVGNIFNAKARDRKEVSMLNEYYIFKKRLLFLLNNMEFDVWKKPDAIAEALYVKDLIKNKQKKQLKRLGLL